MRAMRQLPREVPLVIVALTAKVGQDERDRCKEAGASAYIPKPLEDGADFLTALADCLGMGSGRPTAAEMVG
jgi:CheY-like chemotaxis protein